MATPLLDFLTGRARAALPFLRGFAERGLSPTQALEALKGLSPTFQRQRMLDVYAALQNRVDPERAARLVGQDVPIPQELHFTSPGEQTDNYQYTVGAFDEFGEPLGYLTVGSFVPLSANEIRERANKSFTAAPKEYLDNPKIPIASLSIEEASVSNKVPVI